MKDRSQAKGSRQLHPLRLCFQGHDKSCVKSRATHQCSLISDSQFALIVTSLSIGAKSGCWQSAKIIATPCICLAHLTSKGFAKRHVQPPDDGGHRFKLLAGSPSRSFHQALPRASTSKNIRSMLEYTFWPDRISIYVCLHGSFGISCVYPHTIPMLAMSPNVPPTKRRAQKISTTPKPYLRARTRPSKDTHARHRTSTTC